MTIEKLAEVMPPPAAPFEAFSGPWEPIEAQLRTPLPQDYKDFVRLYGSGDFMEFLGIHVPRSRSPYVRLVSEAHAVAELARVLEDHESPYPYPFWPSPDGLLACGKTDFGDYLFWLARGPPADWRIVVWDRGLGDFETFDCDLTDFLAGLATGEIDPQGFPADMLPCDRLFRPHSYRDYGEFRLAWQVSFGGSPVEGSAGERDPSEPDQD